MSDRKRLSFAVADQESSELFFIGRAVAIDKLRKWLVISPHLKIPEGQRLFCFAGSIGLDRHFKQLLLEAPNANQTLLAIDYGFAAITRYMIARNLNLSDQLIVKRARRLQRFLSQPFVVTQAFTGTPGRSVSRSDTLAGCRAILDGEADDWAEGSLYMVGDFEEARKKEDAAKTKASKP